LILTYTNRRGAQYYLHVRKTKTGKDRYYVSTKLDGASADCLPARYEIYENPNGRVFVRTKRPSRFTSEEVRIVKAGVRKLSSLRPYEYKIDAAKDAITVHLICQDLDGLVSQLNPWMAKDGKAMADLAAKTASYEPMMRFGLADKKRRIFQAERFCFLGGICDWILIGPEGPLLYLVGKFVKHLGKESFYELD